MATLKHGIIGFGFISSKHINGYKSIPDKVETVAICDIDPAKREAAKKAGYQKVYSDYHDMLADAEIDFVSVCLPNYLHKQVTIDALNAGKHVHCEKPMAMNYAEARQMLETSMRTGKKLMIGLNNRYTPVNQFVRKYVEQGNIGEVYFAKCGWTDRMGLPPSGWFTDAEKSGGGAVIDTAVHFIDLVMLMMGYPTVESVTARTFNRLIGDPQIAMNFSFPGMINADDQFTVEDMGTGIINLKGKKSIVFEHTWAANIDEGKRYYYLYGTKGGIEFVNDKVKIIKTINGIQTDTTLCAEVQGVELEDEFSTLADAIISNKDISRIPTDASVMMKIIDGIYTSSKTGKMVDII